MQDQNSSSFNAFIESVGGPDMFIWMIMFGALIIFVAVMLFLNRNNMD